MLLSLTSYEVWKERGRFTEIMLAVICALLKLKILEDCSDLAAEEESVQAASSGWVC